jgi:adenosylcobinamide-GDP ribazoletransferase
VASAAFRRVIAPLLLAGRFLTRLPLPDPGVVSARAQARAVLFYPIIGLLLGAILALLLWLLSVSGAPGPAVAALVLGVWVWGTGALHLDGLADCADAWVGGLGSRERTLSILKDPHAGAMAIVSLIVVLLGKWAALLAVAAAPRPATLSLLCVPALARAQILLLALTTRPARPTGMGAALEHALPRRPAWAMVSGTWLGIALVLGGAGVAAVLVALAVFWAWRRAMLHRLGGFTGDTAGALVELCETAALLTMALLLPVAAGR